MRKRVLAVVFGLLFAFWSSPALAVDAVPCDPVDDLETIELDSDASVHFNGCYLVQDYTPGDTVDVTVDWEITGDADCQSAGDVTPRGRGFTPPPADGEVVADSTTSATDSVMFQTTIDPLKMAGRNKEFAVGHYMVPLVCTTDTNDSIPVYLGVNLRVERELL